MSQSRLTVPKHIARSLACALLVAGSLIATTKPASAATRTTSTPAAECPNIDVTPPGRTPGSPARPRCV